MLLAPVPWTKRMWALPVLTALAPSERYCHEHNIQHKKLTDWARQLVFLLRRWLPKCDIVVVADSGYSALTCYMRVNTYRIPSQSLRAFVWMQLCTRLHLLKGQSGWDGLVLKASDFLP
jgi:hypothetical protein